MPIKDIHLVPQKGFGSVFFVSLFLGLLGTVLLWIPGLVCAVSEIPYRVSFKGLADRKFEQTLQTLSDTVKFSDRPPLSMRLLKRRVDGDVALFMKALRAQGYFAAHVTPEIDTRSDPIQIIFQVETGPLYRIRSVDIQTVKDTPDIIPPDEQAFGLAQGDPARSESILKAERGIIAWYRSQGFPFAGMDPRRALLRHAQQDLAVTFFVDPGPEARFGQTQITGLESVEETFVRSKLPWGEGEPYNEGLLSKGRGDLIETGLFSTVRIEKGESLDQEGRLPITVAVTERKHRSIRAGLSYKTDEGPGASASWENRNLRSRGERVRLGGLFSTYLKEGEGIFRKPAFIREDQTLSLSFRVADDQPDAYTSRSVTSTAMVDRSLGANLAVGGGLSFKASKTDQLGKKETFSLISVPFYLNWNTSDDLLNPTRGGRLFLETAPFFDTFGGDKNFYRAKAGYRHYMQVSERPSLILAGRITLGFMGGAERDDIPADERFYGGGGGSIRGYAYQTVSPLFSGTPVGGRSLIEVSVETRLKCSENFGLVAFLDGGSAFKDMPLDAHEDFLLGAGLGFRYFTPLGPLRFDIGFPLDRRRGIDDAFQIYVSLGQAF